MDDKYDLRELIFSTFDDFLPPLLEGTPLEDSAGGNIFRSCNLCCSKYRISYVILFTIRHFVD